MSFIEKKLNENMGFITENELAQIINENRLQPVLVRCGSGRFVCPAQDVQHFIDIIIREGTDYIRDVSIQRKGDKSDGC